MSPGQGEGGRWSLVQDPGVGISRSMRKLITPKLVLIIITEYFTFLPSSRLLAAQLLGLEFLTGFNKKHKT